MYACYTCPFQQFSPRSIARQQDLSKFLPLCVVVYISKIHCDLPISHVTQLLYHTIPTINKTTFKSIVGNRENAGNQDFLLFPQCFPPFIKPVSVFLLH